MTLTEDQKKLLKDLVEHYEKEDRSIRERQIRQSRRLKLLWEGFSQVWYSEVAHDWRIWTQEENGNSDQSYYDKPVNVFRAFLESIIAALSVTVPPIKCYPEDADNPLDLMTAKAGDKVGKLIYRHNDVSLLWLHALYIYCTEGMVASYHYPKESKEFGVFEKPIEQEVDEVHKFTTCPNCATDINEEAINPEEIPIPPIDELTGEPIIDSPEIPPELCPNCQTEMIPETRTEPVKVKNVIGTEIIPKTRQCIDVYGALYVKIASYAKKQSDTPYLIFSYETDYTLARERYPDIRDKISGGSHGGEPYEQWARVNTQYQGDFPVDNVTIRNNWFRTAAFEIFDEKECKAMKKLFPSGVKIVMVNDEFAEAVDENLDDHWSLTHNPLSDFMYHDPIGMLLISVQELTNDLISLIQQTIEHGIPQTFADSGVLNQQAYGKMETTPGAIYFATPKSGKPMSDAFHEIKTATLSGEVLPFFQKIQELGQLVSGAQPSLFGGQMAGSKTASEYSMSRAQSLQRLQNHWKIITIWWKTTFSKAIPGYINCVTEDEKFVEQDNFGNFVNIFIRKAELEGKIGRIELEANENLPITWAQRKDVIMELLNGQNPQLTQMLGQPQNLPLIYEALGLDDLYIPGEDDRNKQYEEIKELVNSEPMLVPPSEEEIMIAMEQGMEPQEREEPSIEVDPIIDNHQLEFEVCRGWLISDAGRLAKIENESGYKNVMLHALAHQQIMQQQMMEQQMQEMAAQGAGKKPKEDMKAPIKGEERVTS